MKAIEVLKESRQTHVEWRDYFKKNPKSQELEEYKHIGDAEFHEERVKSCDIAIAKLGAQAKEIEQLKNREIDGDILFKWLKQAHDLGLKTNQFSDQISEYNMPALDLGCVPKMKEELEQALKGPE